MRKSIEVPFLVWKFRESVGRLEMPVGVGMTVYYPDSLIGKVVRERGVVRVEVVLIGGEEEDLRVLSTVVGRKANIFKGKLINPTSEEKMSFFSLDNGDPEGMRRVVVMRYEFGRDDL